MVCAVCEWVGGRSGGWLLHFFRVGNSTHELDTLQRATTTHIPQPQIDSNPLSSHVQYVLLYRQPCVTIDTISTKEEKYVTTQL